MNWTRRIICWFSGHDLVKIKYAVKTTKQYHGHDEVRKYSGCGRCGAGSPEKELSWWNGADKNLIERHETTVMILSIIGLMLGIAFIGALVVGIGALILFPLSKYMCELNGAEMGLAAKYNYWTGCYFNVKGAWVADELLSVVDLLK